MPTKCRVHTIAQHHLRRSLNQVDTLLEIMKPQQLYPIQPAGGRVRVGEEQRHSQGTE